MLVPKLRFKGYQAPWYNLLIKDIMKITSGQGFKASEYALSDKENQIRLLQIENIKYGTIQWGANTAYLPLDYLDKYSHLVLRKDDIVLALNRPVTNNQLKIAILTSNDSPSILYQRVGRCDFLRNENNYFYFYLLQKELKNFVIKQSIGSDQPFISLGALYKHQVTTTQKSEQNKIADFLSSTDEKIALQSRKIELLEQYKKGMMQKLFSQKIRLKDDHGNFYPEWKKQSIEDIGIVIGGGTPDTSNLLYWNGDIPWFTPTEIVNRFVYKSNRLITKEGVNASSAKLLPAGAILFTSRATIGDIAIAKIPCTTNQGFQSIVVSKDYNNLFIYYMLITMKPTFIRTSSGSTFLEISKSAFKKIEIKTPVKSEQDKIAGFLSSIDDKIAIENTKLDKLKQWKQGLLQQMFV